MSHSIRNRWRNRASPFQTDQKHAEEMWITSSAASLDSGALSRDLYRFAVCDIAKGKLRGKYTFKMRFRWKKLRATKYIYYSNKKNNLCWKVTPVHPELQEISRLWLITGNKETDDRFSFTHFFFLFLGGGHSSLVENSVSAISWHFIFKRDIFLQWSVETVLKK